MRMTRARALALVLATITAVFLGQLLASEWGEVVVLETVDGEGKPASTRLWIVDHDASIWLRTKEGGSGWSGRLLASETFTVERDGVRRSYVATPTPDQSEKINQLMREKYGFADLYVALFLGGREGSLPIRLELRSEASPQT